MTDRDDNATPTADPTMAAASAPRDAPTDAHPWVGTPQHYHWLRGIVACVLVLNGIDAVMTVVWIQSGLAVEANPLVAELVHTRPVAFAGGKLLLVSLGSWLLWRRRREPLAVVGIFAAFLVYYWILLVHLRAFRVVLVSDWLVGAP
ncbi:MAG: hypothetical protein FJ100_02340 [Deltaproteobacteria bacterium]|nr:hypothetical protein [Deltaproteobacteria bacterium]